VTIYDLRTDIDKGVLFNGKLDSRQICILVAARR